MNFNGGRIHLCSIRMLFPAHNSDCTSGDFLSDLCVKDLVLSSIIAKEI